MKSWYEASSWACSCLTREQMFTGLEVTGAKGLVSTDFCTTGRLCLRFFLSLPESSFLRPRRFLYFSVKKFKYILKIFTFNKASIYKTEEPPQMFNRRNVSLCFHIKLVKCRHRKILLWWIKETHQQVLVFNHLSLAYSGGPWVMPLSLRRLHHWGGSVMMIISHFWQLATCGILVQWKVPNLHHSSSHVFALCKVIHWALFRCAGSGSQGTH